MLEAMFDFFVALIKGIGYVLLYTIGLPFLIIYLIFTGLFD